MHFSSCTTCRNAMQGTTARRVHVVTMKLASALHVSNVHMLRNASRAMSPKHSTPYQMIAHLHAIDHVRHEKVANPLTEPAAPCRVADDRDQYGCFFFHEKRASELTLFLGVGPTAFIMFKFMNGQDIFGIGPEIVHVIGPITIGGGTPCSVAQMHKCN